MSMMPDDFLDWLEEKHNSMTPGGSDEAIIRFDFLSELIRDFNNEFDTRDSPNVPMTTGRKKKLKKKPKRNLQYPYGEGNQGPGTGPIGERLI